MMMMMQILVDGVMVIRVLSRRSLSSVYLFVVCVKETMSQLLHLHFNLYCTKRHLNVL